MRTISYDEKATGRKVVLFPPDLPFSAYREELALLSGDDQRYFSPSGPEEDRSVYDLSSGIIRHLSIAENPQEDILRIVSAALSGESDGITLLYAMILAVPSLNQLAMELIDFRNVRRIMERFSEKEENGTELMESEKWFVKKVMLLSMSLPLPGGPAENSNKPWLAWEAGVRRALADPDTRWNEAVTERVKVELEARNIRVRMLAASLDPDRRTTLAISLGSLGEEIRWKIKALEELRSETDSSPLLLRRGLELNWEQITGKLRETGAGNLVADLFDIQSSKAHSYPQIRNGTAVMRALLQNPMLARTGKTLDIPSCLYLFAESAKDGILEIMIPKGKDTSTISDIPGFTVDDKLIRIDLAKIPSGIFTDENGMPADIDWTTVSIDKAISFKSLVMSNIDNDSFLASLLNNPKAISKPGIMPLIAIRCRSLRILSLISNRREYYTGFANKEVPLNLLRNPAKISLTALRKFIHVRYVDKMTLQKLSNMGGGQIREEVRREIRRYLNTVG